VAAADVYKDWTVGWVNGVNPDGMMERRAIGVNGQWPPEIIVSGRDRGASSAGHGLAHTASPARDLC
jgi:iron transport multicopper oxidase